MPEGYVLTFARGVEVQSPSTDCAVIRAPITHKAYSIDGLSPRFRRIIDILASAGATEDELADLIAETDGEHAQARLYYYLMGFAEQRLLSYGISCGDRSLAVLSPISAHFRFLPTPVDAQSRYALSRFAYLHREYENLILESPLAHGMVTLTGWEGAAVAAELARPRTPEALRDALGGIPIHAVKLFLEMLVGAGFVSELKPDQPYPGENKVLAQWAFHDMLFHARSRLGRHANPFGGTYPLTER